MKNKKIVTISLGGSIIVPDEIDWEFVRDFKKLIKEQIVKGYRFIIITGGGKLARRYQEAAIKITRKITAEDQDWLGIHATRMNGHFIRTIFRDLAHPIINTNPNDLENFYGFKESILVAAGWRPGFSTDYDAVLLGKYFGVRKIINLSNIDYVYSQDPKKYPQAKKLEKLTWAKFRKIVGDKWDPGLNAPFDPIASKIAQANGMEVAIMNGRNLKNIQNYLEGKKIKGTIII